MFLGYLTSNQLLKQNKNKMGEVKKRKGRNVSCICYQGEREGSGILAILIVYSNSHLNKAWMMLSKTQLKM